MFLLYNLLLPILSPIWFPLVWLKSKRRHEQPNWKERFGNYDHLGLDPKRNRIWFHAVSVGEVLSSAPLLRELRERFPTHDILLSVTTSSGHQAAREKLADLFDHIVYFPIDVLRWQMSAMQRVRPDYVLVMETELWMNFLYCAKLYDAKTMVVNGRISDKSFRTSQRLKGYYSTLFQWLDKVGVQSETDADRFMALGAKRVEVLGNIKFDQANEGLDANRDDWLASLGFDTNRTTIVVGSTRGAEEEDWILDALQQVGLDRLNVLFAPRHLERIPALAAQLQNRGISFAKRSEEGKGAFVVLDTYGELSGSYCIADIVIIGGGFLPLGGQNLIQALAHGKPVVHGPYMSNFRDVTAMAIRAGASRSAEGQNLGSVLEELVSDPDRRISMGEAAASLVLGNLGASGRYVKALPA